MYSIIMDTVGLLFTIQDLGLAAANLSMIYAMVYMLLKIQDAAVEQTLKMLSISFYIAQIILI